MAGEALGAGDRERPLEGQGQFDRVSLAVEQDVDLDEVLVALEQRRRWSDHEQLFAIRGGGIHLRPVGPAVSGREVR